MTLEERFPWRGGNRFELLIDGAQFFAAMLQAIRKARHTVLLDLYLFESGSVATRFVNAFCEAAARGVSVYLMLDDFGAHGLQQADRRRLHRSGVHLAFYNPLHYGTLRRNLFRDHRKLLVVDDTIAFTGGAGITDQFDTRGEPPHGWHEVMLAIRGPVVADWQRLFSESWNLWGSPPLAVAEAAHRSVGEVAGRVTLNAPSRMEIKRSLIKHLRNAEQRVWIATAYFIPSWKIRRLLRQAARRGVDVRLLLPGPHTDHPAVRHAGRRFYTRLLQNGVRIFEYQPRFLHAKLLLCDDWLSIGSSNIDRWNLRWNLEANQELLGGAAVAQAGELFLQDFAQSREITPATWHGRSRLVQLQEWFWGRVDRWLGRLNHPSGGARGERE